MIPTQILSLSKHMQIIVKLHWFVLKFLSRNKIKHISDVRKSKAITLLLQIGADDV